MFFKGREATVVIRDWDVLKTYNARYFRWNRRHGRKGEPHFLQKCLSPFIVRFRLGLRGGRPELYSCPGAQQTLWD